MSESYQKNNILEITNDPSCQQFRLNQFVDGFLAVCFLLKNDPNPWDTPQDLSQPNNYVQSGTIMAWAQTQPNPNPTTSTLPTLTLLGPQSRFGDKPLKFQVVCPQNETAVLKGLTPTRARKGPKTGEKRNPPLSHFPLFFIYIPDLRTTIFPLALPVTVKFQERSYRI